MFISTHDGCIQTATFGTGPRTFVAHGGWTGSWELWHEPFELMSASWRCVGFDHRGSGASLLPTEGMTAQTLVDDLFLVLDALNVEKCVLAGESMGGLIACLAVNSRPERFDGLVLVDAAGAVTPDRVGGLVAGSRANYPATAAAFVDLCLPAGAPAHIRAWGEKILARSTGDDAARLFEGCYGVTPDLAAIRVPTLVIHSKDDRVVPIEFGRMMAGAISGARIVELDQAGHVPTVTRAGEVATAINEFFGA